MVNYQQWSQTYYTNLTPDQHNMNNRWFQSIRDKLTDSELKERVDCYDDVLYDELVDNVTNETVLDVNNTGGKY